MKEKELKIKLADGHYLYGQFSGSFSRPLFIVLHGLSGDMSEDIYSSAVEWFYKKKYSTFRFNFYSYQKNARQLMDSTIKIQSSDLDTVVKYFRKKGIKNIFVVGHSFAAPIVLSSNDQDFNSVVFWDPTYKISFTKNTLEFPSGKYLKEIDGYAMHWGVNIIISKLMVKEVDSFPWSTVTKDFDVPLKIIAAGDGELTSSKKYLNSLRAKKQYVSMKGATHYFNDSPKTRETLFKSTNTWFKKFL